MLGCSSNQETSTSENIDKIVDKDFVVVGETQLLLIQMHAILVGPQVDVKERFFVGSA